MFGKPCMVCVCVCVGAFVNVCVCSCMHACVCLSPTSESGVDVSLHHIGVAEAREVEVESSWSSVERGGVSQLPSGVQQWSESLSHHQSVECGQLY